MRSGSRRPGVPARRSFSDRKVVSLAVILFSLIAVGTAVAHHVDSMMPTVNANCMDGTLGDPFCQTDNATFTIWRQSSITPTGKSRIGSVLNNEFEPTDLDVVFVSEPSFTGGAETDVIYQQGSVPGTNIGITWCNDAVSSTKCDQHYVRFESDTPGTALACHETGHSVGLTHGQDARPQLSNQDPSLQCMQNPASTSNLGTHNTQLINDTYPN
jgi:hypothetical protein